MGRNLAGLGLARTIGERASGRGFTGGTRITDCPMLVLLWRLSVGFALGRACGAGKENGRLQLSGKWQLES